MTLYCSPEYQTSDSWGGAIFYSRAVIWASHLDTSNEILCQLAFQFRTRSLEQNFKMAAMAAISDFQLEGIKIFLIYKSPQYIIWNFLSVQEK